MAQTARSAFPYSDEQLAIIHDPAPILVAKALAGTGKTTTAIGYAAARPRSSFLYLAFNKGIQMEASTRFGPNTKCQTTHSVAFQALGKYYGDRVVKSWRAMSVRSEAGLPTVRAAAMVQSVLNKFFHSGDPEISLTHAQGAETEFHARERELYEAVANAKHLWRRMQDKNDSVSMPHDAYLKMWSLTNPRLDYDHIICDEWQDANAVTAHIINQQRHAKLLVIGDPHQSIYAFRGAINAMDDFAGARQLHLSQTWRFGPKVAAMANLLLGELKGESLKIQGMGRDVPYQKGASVTKLSRTNAQLFKDATLVHGKGVHWVGGIENYQIEKILDAYHLYTKKRDKIRDPFLRNFASFGELSSYAEEARDPEARVLSQLIEEYRHEVPGLVQEVRANEVKDPADADLRLTTAHKGKGLDWDYVQVADDFEILAETEAALAADPYALIDEQEINLLYVAFTRAKKALQVNSETRAWLEQLPKHREARARAQDKSKLRLMTRSLQTSNT